MSEAEFDAEYESILNSRLNFEIKWIAIDLLRQEHNRRKAKGGVR